MNKKSIVVLLALVCGIACGLGLAGCSNNDESDNSPHEHNYSIKWSYDDTDHWHACTGAGCKEVTDKAAHTWDDGVVMMQPTCGTAGGKVFTCTVCKITKTEIIAATGNHNFSDGWYEDNTYHWHVCEKCGSADNKEEHDWDNGVITREPSCSSVGIKTYTCVTCNKTKSEDIIVPHSFLKEWTTDDTHHWHECEKCGFIDDKVEHIWENDVCTVCKIHKPSEGLEYELSSNGQYYSVSGIGTCTDKDVYIPHLYNGKPVEYISQSAFAGCTSIESVTIGNAVVEINDGAFEDCTSLKSVTIGDKVESIGDSAFTGCASLAEVHIKDLSAWCNIYFGFSEANPLSYGAKLYFNGTPVSELIIPAEVKEIVRSAFAGCGGLKRVIIPDSVENIGGLAFDGCASLESVTIGSGVTTIDSGAFRDCSALTNVIIPDSVEIIDLHAFMGCTSLKSVTVGNGVTEIRDYAFGSCTSLESITIGNGVKSIGNSAFRDCSALKSIKFGNSLESMGDRAFEGCTSLQSVIMGDGIASISYSAFYECSALTSVTFGSGVEDIEAFAFVLCSALTQITYEGTMEQWAAIIKSINWDFATGNYTVYCTDGEIVKEN